MSQRWVFIAAHRGLGLPLSPLPSFHGRHSAPEAAPSEIYLGEYARRLATQGANEREAKMALGPAAVGLANSDLPAVSDVQEAQDHARGSMVALGKIQAIVAAFFAV